jgi:Tfp pilus assembly protein PilN
MKAVNLLPSDQRGSQKTPAGAAAPKPGGSAFGAYAVLGALVFSVVAMAAYVLTTNTINDRKSELARVTQETQVTQAKAAALQSFADFKALADQRVTTVQGLATSRFDWERTLTDLSRALPSDVHLKSLSGSTGTQVGGGGGNSLRGAIQAPALELSGCTTSQAAVARLMSRLRNVRGVTRVSLTKSETAAAGATGVATAPALDGSTPGSLCPKGAPPAFDLVVFFERSAIAAGASPNLGAATAATPNAAAQAGGAAATQAGTTTGAQADSTGSTSTQPAGQSGATQGVSAP